MTKPFRMQVRIRNNIMIKARESMGFDTAAAFCRTNSIGHSLLSSYESMRESPLRVAPELVHTCALEGCERWARSMHSISCSFHIKLEQELRKQDWLPVVWKSSALRVATVLFEDPETLWPKEVLQVKKSVSRNVEVDMAEMKALVSDPSDLLDAGRLGGELRECMKVLTPRQESILRMRYGIGYERALSLEEVAKEIGVTRERIRQIESKAILKMRHPNIAGQLAPHHSLRAEKQVAKDMDVIEAYTVDGVDQRIRRRRPRQRQRVIEEVKDRIAERDEIERVRERYGRMTDSRLKMVVRGRMDRPGDPEEYMGVDPADFSTEAWIKRGFYGVRDGQPTAFVPDGYSHWENGVGWVKKD